MSICFDTLIFFSIEFQCPFMNPVMIQKLILRLHVLSLWSFYLISFLSDFWIVWGGGLLRFLSSTLSSCFMTLFYIILRKRSKPVRFRRYSCFILCYLDFIPEYCLYLYEFLVLEVFFILSAVKLFFILSYIPSTYGKHQNLSNSEGISASSCAIVVEEEM